jgi:hypothetical protein
MHKERVALACVHPPDVWSEWLHPRGCPVWRPRPQLVVRPRGVDISSTCRRRRTGRTGRAVRSPARRRNAHDRRAPSPPRPLPSSRRIHRPKTLLTLLHGHPRSRGQRLTCRTHGAPPQPKHPRPHRLPHRPPYATASKPRCPQPSALRTTPRPRPHPHRSSSTGTRQPCGFRH